MMTSYKKAKHLETASRWNLFEDHMFHYDCNYSLIVLREYKLTSGILVTKPVKVNTIS